MRILLLTYHFPPERSVGGDRPLSLFRHGPGEGVEVDVATVSNHGTVPGETGVLRMDAIAGWSRPRELPRKLLPKLLTKLREPFAMNVDFRWYGQVRRRL